MQRQAYIARFHEAMRELLGVVSALPAPERPHPALSGWSVKDVLAHIAAWDRELVRALDEVLGGRRPTFTTEPEDAFNARAVAASRHLSVRDVMADVQEAHAALVRRLEGLSEAEWQYSSPHHWRDDTPMTVASLFDYTYRGETHYGGHARELAALNDEPAE